MDQFTVAQWAEMTGKCVLTGCVWDCFHDGFPHYALTAQSDHCQSAGSRVYTCLVQTTTYHLHFGQNDPGLLVLHATAVTQGWNRSIPKWKSIETEKADSREENFPIGIAPARGRTRDLPVLCLAIHHQAISPLLYQFLMMSHVEL